MNNELSVDAQVALNNLARYYLDGSEEGHEVGMCAKLTTMTIGADWDVREWRFRPVKTFLVICVYTHLGGSAQTPFPIQAQEAMSITADTEQFMARCDDANERLKVFGVYEEWEPKAYSRYAIGLSKHD